MICKVYNTVTVIKVRQKIRDSKRKNVSITVRKCVTLSARDKDTVTHVENPKNKLF